jgi:hypothetical protein
MGRNYIAERTIADPRVRAAVKRKKEADIRRRRAAEAASLASYVERSKWCKAGCGNLAIGGVGGWWPCCSQECWSVWNEKLQSR